MINKYAGACVACDKSVGPGEGSVYKNPGERRWRIYCERDSMNYSTHAVSNVIHFSSGETFYRNKNGRCEDAPCCGCCTI